MRKKYSLGILILMVSLLNEAANSQHGVLSSQIGYDNNETIRVIVRSDRSDYITPGTKFRLQDSDGNMVLSGNVLNWGQKWGSYWWIVNISGLQTPGKYSVIIDDINTSIRSESFNVGNHLLWSECFHIMAFDNLKIRSEQARTGMGWKDCGGDLQEFSSHVVAVDAICDLLEIGTRVINSDERSFLLEQMLRGTEYLAHLQDKAKSLGLGNGCVVHEDRQIDVVTGDVAKAAMIFARVARLIRETHKEISIDYIERSKNAFSWIEKHGPVINPEEQIFFPYVHGAPEGSVPPEDQWMTRDLVMMIRASIELFRAGETSYKNHAIQYAEQVMNRQVPKAENESGLFGHFYTYDDYSPWNNFRFTEKANIHCGAWSREGRIYNKGGHYPHYLIPIIDMIKLWPDHKNAQRWQNCLYNFAYGYFMPACKQSPFLILPAGYYSNEGLLYFSSWYHGHNKIYAFAATLALEFQKFFNDDQFREIAIGNIQWIAGLNCGLIAKDSSQYLPVSMISGIGSRTHGSYSKFPGSICNGFSASRQFRIVPAKYDLDKPVFFDEEDYIAHALPYLAALIRLRSYDQVTLTSNKPSQIMKGKILIMSK